MEVSAENSRPTDRLESWKEISVYLCCSIKTVQRREKKGLPIYRNSAMGFVWAYKSELDHWRSRWSEGGAPITEDSIEDLTCEGDYPQTSAFAFAGSLQSREPI